MAVIVGSELPVPAPDGGKSDVFLAGWHDGWPIGYETGRLRHEPTTAELAAKPGGARPRDYRLGWHEGWLAGHEQGRERAENSFDDETAA